MSCMFVFARVSSSHEKCKLNCLNCQFTLQQTLIFLYMPGKMTSRYGFIILYISCCCFAFRVSHANLNLNNLVCVQFVVHQINYTFFLHSQQAFWYVIAGKIQVELLILASFSQLWKVVQCSSEWYQLHLLLTLCTMSKAYKIHSIF